MTAPAESFAYLNARAKSSALRAECYRWEASAAEVLGDNANRDHYRDLAEQCERRAVTWERWAADAPDAPRSVVEPAEEQRSGFHQVTVDRRVAVVPVLDAPPAAAVPDCGACAGDGTMCPKVCRHAEENPPTTPEGWARLREQAPPAALAVPADHPALAAAREAVRRASFRERTDYVETALRDLLAVIDSAQPAQQPAALAARWSPLSVVALWKCAREHNSTIPDDELDAMRDALLAQLATCAAREVEVDFLGVGRAMCQVVGGVVHVGAATMKDLEARLAPPAALAVPEGLRAAVKQADEALDHYSRVAVMPSRYALALRRLRLAVGELLVEDVVKRAQGASDGQG